MLVVRGRPAAMGGWFDDVTSFVGDVGGKVLDVGAKIFTAPTEAVLSLGEKTLANVGGVANRTLDLGGKAIGGALTVAGGVTGALGPRATTPIPPPEPPSNLPLVIGGVLALVIVGFALLGKPRGVEGARP